MADHTHNPRFASWREQAENTLSRHDVQDIQYVSVETLREFYHELRVHQVELQLQNEELQRAHHQAAAERDRFAKLYDSLPVACLTVDSQGIIHEVNRSGRLLLEGSTDDITGRKLADYVNMEDQDAYFLFMRRLFRTERQQGELRLQRPRQHCWMARVEGEIVTTSQITDQTYRLVLSDITARYQAESLRAQRDWLDVTLSSMGDALITTDTNGEVTFLNRAAVEFTGWPASAAVGHPLDMIWSLVVEGTRQPAGHLVCQLFQPDRAHETAMHMILVSRVDPKRVVSACAATILSSEGPPQGAVVVFRDISEQRELEARLLQTQKMEALGTLAGGIAHDFNNILTAILGYTHVSVRSLDADNPVQSHLKEVRAAAIRAKEFVQHILTFTRQNQIERQPAAIYSVVQEALSLLRMTLPATVNIELCLNPEAGTVLAQQDNLLQVLMNLCANAEHAMRKHGGTLRLGLDVLQVDTQSELLPSLTPGSYIQLTVEDTGPGIPTDVLPHIFEPYYTTKAVGEGSGLGLAIVHGIVASHQGTITVDSTLGIGTTFTVYLPRISDAAPEEPATLAPPEASPGTGECILLIEDQEPVALATEMQLSELGYRVVTHLTSASALEAFQADPQQFDLVLTDQTMPAMTGEEIAHVIHSNRPDVPIILVTGFSHLVDAAKAQTLGIDAFLIKPWDVREMADTIQRVLAQRRA